MGTWAAALLGFETGCCRGTEGFLSLAAEAGWTGEEFATCCYLPAIIWAREPGGFGAFNGSSFFFSRTASCFTSLPGMRMSDLGLAAASLLAASS